MKKIIITVIMELVLILGLTACEEASLEESEDLFVKETKEEIRVPEKYSFKAYMHNADKSWLYFTYRDKTDKDNAPLRGFRMSKKTGDITEYPLISKSGLIKCIRGYKGKLYIGRTDENTDNPVYRLFELDKGAREVIYKKRVDELPMTMSSGNKEIMAISQINNKGVAKRTLEVFDLETRETTVIDKAKTAPSKKDYGMDGTAFMGFDYSFESASKEGFCYEKCKYNGEDENTEYGGKNKVYYYSFKTGEKVRLEDPVGTLEYINGTPEIYLTSTFTGGVNSDGTENLDDDYGEANMFIKESDTYKKICLNQIIEGSEPDAEVGASGTMCFGGMVGKDNVVFKSADAGFFIVNKKSLQYCYVNFRSEYDDEDEQRDYSYPANVGDSYDSTKQTLSFLTRETTKSGDKYVLHTLSDE